MAPKILKPNVKPNPYFTEEARARANINKKEKRLQRKEKKRHLLALRARAAQDKLRNLSGTFPFALKSVDSPY